jgi:hypothetical protein
MIINSSINSSPIVLEPIDKNQNIEEIGIIFVQGALLKPEQYLKLSKKIQESAKEFKIWVSISETFFDLPISILGKRAIEACFAELIKKGFNQKSKIFLIGHSLGGEAALDYFMNNKDSSKKMNINQGGLIMLGSIPTRDLREKTKKLNLLIIGGELDGLSRLTRTAEEFYNRNYNAKGNFVFYKNQNQKSLELKNLQFLMEENLNENQNQIKTENEILEKENNKINSKTAVIALEGLNHMSFAGGEASSFVKLRDLKAEISEEKGHEKISQVISYFLKGDENSLNNEIKKTKELIKPLIDAFEFEGSLHFNRPQQTKCRRGFCGDGTNWTIEAQKIISKEKDLKVKLNISNNYVILSSLPPLGDLFHPKMSYDKNTNTMSISTYSQCAWEILDKYVDGGFAPVSAKEIGSKMYSRQCSLVYGAGKKKEDTPITVDTTGNICASINEAAYNWALKNASKKAIERFEKYGQKLKFVDDKYFENGFSWTYNILDFSEDKKTGDMNVKSWGMYTTIDAKPLPIFAPDGLACYHYCKNLSPARASEWIHIDGLRKKYHI